MVGARPIGIISGTAEQTRIAFFKKSTLSGFPWREQFSTLDATQILRFAARCEKQRCCHFDGEHCSLGARIRRELPPVVDELPACSIRANCRWFAEQGRDVCLRCPQIVSMIPAADSAMNRIAMVPLEDTP